MKYVEGSIWTVALVAFAIVACALTWRLTTEERAGMMMWGLLIVSLIVGFLASGVGYFAHRCFRILEDPASLDQKHRNFD